MSNRKRPETHAEIVEDMHNFGFHSAANYFDKWCAPIEKKTMTNTETLKANKDDLETFIYPYGWTDDELIKQATLGNVSLQTLINEMIKVRTDD